MLKAFNNKKEIISIKDALSTEKYYCPLCDEALILKKGLKRRHHFAHKPNGMCSESKYADKCEWHFKWQERFPDENIEVLKIDDDGKKHIADALVNNIEIEFQHSYMPYEEFNDRNEFYSKLGYHIIWVFDGNDVFNNGYNGGPFPFSKRFECLKYLTSIPEYLDIFIEGEIQQNLFTEAGLFLHHVSGIDEKLGIIFNGKCTIEEFMNNVSNGISFDFEIKEKTQVQNINLYKAALNAKSLIDIAKQYADADFLIAYNARTYYDVLINKTNIGRLIQGQKAYGKLKKHDNYGKFIHESSEIYYSKDEVWVYQNHY